MRKLLYVQHFGGKHCCTYNSVEGQNCGPYNNFWDQDSCTYNSFGALVDDKTVVRRTVSHSEPDPLVLPRTAETVGDKTVLRTTVSHSETNPFVPPRIVETSEEVRNCCTYNGFRTSTEAPTVLSARTDLVRNVKLLYLQQFWDTSVQARNCCTHNDCAPEASTVRTDLDGDGKLLYVQQFRGAGG